MGFCLVASEGFPDFGERVWLVCFFIAVSWRRCGDCHLSAEMQGAWCGFFYVWGFF